MTNFSTTDRASIEMHVSHLVADLHDKRLIVDEFGIDPMDPAEIQRKFTLIVRQREPFNPLAGSDGNSRSVNEAAKPPDADGITRLRSDDRGAWDHPASSKSKTVPAPGALPCPFCGSADIYNWASEDHGPGTWSVMCFGCECEGPHTDSEAAAIEQWNERPPCGKCFDATNRANGLERELSMAQSDVMAFRGASLVDQICRTIDDWRMRKDPFVRVSEIWSAFEEIADKLNECIKEHAGPKLAVDNDQAAHDALRDMLEKPFPGYGTFIMDDLPPPELGSSRSKIPPRPFMPQQHDETDYAFRKRVRLVASELAGASPARLSAIDIAIGKTLDMFGREYGLVRNKPVTKERLIDTFARLYGDQQRVCPADLMLAATQPVISSRIHDDDLAVAFLDGGTVAGLPMEYHAGPEPIRPREEQPVVAAVVNQSEPALWDTYRMSCQEFNRRPCEFAAKRVTADFRRWADAFCKTPFPGLTVQQSIDQMVARLARELQDQVPSHG